MIGVAAGAVVGTGVQALLVRVVPVPATLSLLAFSALLAIAPACALLAGFQAWTRPSRRTFRLAAVGSVLLLPLSALDNTEFAADRPQVRLAAVLCGLVALWVVIKTALYGFGRLVIVLLDLWLDRVGKKPSVELFDDWYSRATTGEQVAALMIVVFVCALGASWAIEASPPVAMPFGDVISSAVLSVAHEARSIGESLVASAVILLLVASIDRSKKEKTKRKHGKKHHG